MLKKLGLRLKLRVMEPPIIVLGIDLQALQPLGPTGSTGVNHWHSRPACVLCKQSMRQIQAKNM
jgi:hypothetical protein